MVSVQSSHTSQMQTGKKRKKCSTDPDLLTRTSWSNAGVALAQIYKGKATGNRAALWLRSKIQNELFKLGCFIQRHAGKVLFVGLFVLFTFCVGLKSATMESRVEKLWVEDGGRLQREIDYVEAKLGTGAGATNEMMIQTPVEDSGSASILTPDALIGHLDVLKAATKVVVEMDDVAWKLKDLCYAPTIPLTENHMIDKILDNLFPCSIITPLDCFWEGSQLLSRDYPVHVPLGGEGSMLLSWTTLNPMQLLHQLNSYSERFDNNFSFKSFEDFMKRAGITSGYQEKPCLRPNDPDCPSTAANKNTRQLPDVGAELTGGCYGFATRFMHWPEQLIVGGLKKNKTGHIVRAKGLQSIVQLMGEKDLYDYWSDTYKVHTLDWSRSKAGRVLREWQKKFNEEVRSIVRDNGLDKKFDVNAFSSMNLDSILEEFSEFSAVKVALGYVLMLIYACLMLSRYPDVLRSQSGLGLGGVLLVIITVAGGLGLSSLIGITFNASTTQIVPFLALGLGVDAMFLLAHSYAEERNVAHEDQIGEVLRRTGVSIFLTAICNIAAFLAAAVIPIPALRAFAFQAAILLAFNLLSMLLLFPAILSLDLRRINAKRIDIFCCYSTENKKKETDVHVSHVKLPPRTEEYPKSRSMTSPVTSSTDLIRNEEADRRCPESSCFKWTLTSFAEKYYSKWITQTPVKVLVIVLCIVMTGAGLWGISKLKDGLELTEIVPRNTSAYNFLKAQDKYFGFYNMYAVSRGNFEYPQNQKLLYDYHNAFVRVENIIKNDDGGLPEFWLSLFRNWLARIQSAFDDDFAQGNIHDGGWHANASDDGVLAFKLLVQTGHVDYPVDMTLLHRNRLVDAHGMINPSAFYNYLSAWYSNDAMAYSYSQGNIVPTPKDWFHDPRDHDMLIPKSQPVEYAQIPFYLNNVGETEVMVATISQIRELCHKFEEKGLPNFPSGVPFTFWEQYLTLRSWLLVALASVLCAVFFVISFLLMNPWIAGVVIVVIASILVQLAGVMGIIGIKLSAVPAVIFIMAVGLAVEFTVHICIGFITAIGSKSHRIRVSLSHMFAPVLHGIISTFLGILMLAFSHFDFIVRYFFLVLTALILLGAFNGLIFLPVLLVLVGPPAEVVPVDGGTEIQPPTPEPSPQIAPKAKHRIVRAAPSQTRLSRRHPSDLSLSTIAEESCASSEHVPITQSSINSGASVVVEPHVVVETTTYPSPHHSTNGSSDAPQVTKVTATAKFKVEVHAPPPLPLMDRPSSARSRRGSGVSGTPSSGTPSESLRSSLSNSVSSSLSSNEGDLGFSEK